MLLKQKKKNTLDPPVTPQVLCVIELRKSGVAILQGSDATTISHQVSKLAHCSVPVIDRTYTRRRLSGRIRFIASDVETGNHSQLCYSAMFAMKDGISHALKSHWIRFHRGDGCVRNTKLLMYAVDRHELIPGDVRPV